MIQLFVTKTYERAIRKLLSEAARRDMEAAVLVDPGRAPVISGTGGIRKLRWAGSGRGKRGGIRTIYFYHAGPEAVYMLTAYAKADRDDLTPEDRRVLSRLVAAIKKEGKRLMSTARSRMGHEIETALGEVLAHVRGEVELPCRVMDDPSAERIRALRKRLRLSRERFAERFGLDARAVQDWEQGRRVPDRAARVLLTVIDREPEAVIRALRA